MINRNLKQIRNTRGILQRDITDKYGISQSYYSLIENGYRNPSLDFAKKISLALNISLDEVYKVLEVQSGEIRKYKRNSSGIK